MSLNRLFSFLCAVGAVLFLSIPEAHAHGLNLSIEIDEQVIAVRAYFGKHSPCRSCQVSAKDDEGNEVFSGRTDPNGRATFRPENLATSLAITANDSMGHRATQRISKEQLKGLATDPGDSNVKDAPETPSDAEHPCLNRSEVEALIRKEVAEQIKASKPSIGNDNTDPSFSIRDLIAGLGFIFGLSGLILAVSKKRKA